MPPQRTTPIQRSVTKPITKPIKSERTHEENQERAYIAASRRSDRSLEARIESARRASEIHKHRTGRALRVTESDVVNEEMYEEEDDEPSPHLYRGLGLLMGGTPIDRRFAAYYQHQMYMKNIMDLALHDISRPAMPGTHMQNDIYNNPYLQQQLLLQQQHHQLQNHPPQQQHQSQHYPYFVHSVPPAQLQASYRQHPYRMSQNAPSAAPAVPSTPAPQVPRLSPQATPARQSQSPAPLSPDTTKPADKSSSRSPQSDRAQHPACVSYTESPQLQLTSNTDVNNATSSIFPFTDELPPESVRFLRGQMMSPGIGMSPYANTDLFDHSFVGNMKGYTTSLSPDPVSDLKPVNVVSTLSTPGDGYMAPNSDDLIGSLFDESLISVPTSSTLAHEQVHYDPFSDQDTWDQYMNPDWVDSPIV